MARSHKKSPMH